MVLCTSTAAIPTGSIATATEWPASHDHRRAPTSPLWLSASDMTIPAPLARAGTPSMARLAVPLVAIALAACGEGEDGALDPTPEKIDGTPSHEFERDDLERAEDAS